MRTFVNTALSSHSFNGDAVLVSETDRPVEGGLMIPIESADLGEDGASSVGLALSMEQEVAKGKELGGMLVDTER